MKMNKKIRVTMAVILGICAVMYCVRVAKVNADVSLPKVKTYGIGEVVPYGKDFMEDTCVSSEGYSIKVLGTHAYTKKEFSDKYDVKIEGDMPCDYVYTVNVKIYNDNKKKKKKGIFVGNMYLKSVNYFSFPQAELTAEISKLPGAQFCLRPESDMDITLVYDMNRMYFDSLDEIKNTKFNMMITNNPTEKIIKLRK